MRPNLALIGLILIALLMAACSPLNPGAVILTPTIISTQEDLRPTISALETLVAITPTLAPTNTATLTLAPTNTAIVTLAPTGTGTVTLMPTGTLTPIPATVIPLTPTLALTATFLPTATQTSVSTATDTPTATPTLAPTFTATPVATPCNRAGFVADVTIPDGTLTEPGSTFTKTWRLRNDGTCTWSPDYQLVFVSGNQLGGLDQLRLGNTIAPGQTIDISLVLIAPGATGAYKASYMLKDAAGTSFGVGDSGNNAFFVSIQNGTSLPSNTAQANLSTTRANAGSQVTVYVSGFPANAEIDYRIGKQGAEITSIYDGTVGADGTASKTITIPPTAVSGEYWVVQVLTTSLKDVLTVPSHSIYITNTGSVYPGDIQVSLSSLTARPGDPLTVYVRGFPANAEIDFRVGKPGETYRSVYDGTVGTNGTTIQTITIPTSAVAGEYWVVQVTTTNRAEQVTFTSHTVYISN